MLENEIMVKGLMNNILGSRCVHKVARKVVIMLLVLSVATVAWSRDTVDAASLIETANGYVLSDLDSAECYARRAFECSPERSYDKMRAANLMGRVSFLRVEYVEASRMFQYVIDKSADRFMVIDARLGLMKICQRVSDNVSFYQQRNEILLGLMEMRQESDGFTAEQNRLLDELETSFRMESALYYHALEQHEQAILEFKSCLPSVVQGDGALRLKYELLNGMGIGLDSWGRRFAVDSRLHALEYCLQHGIESGNIRIQGLAMTALAGIVVEYGAQPVMESVHESIWKLADVEGVGPDSLALVIAGKALDVVADFGAVYETVECEALLASCCLENERYDVAVAILDDALSILNEVRGENYPHVTDIPRLESFRVDGMIVESEWMKRVPLATVPEILSHVRQLMSQAYSGMDNKDASDYNRNVYLEIQKNIRLDRKYEARALLLKSSNTRLASLLVFMIVLILVVITLFVFQMRRAKVGNRRYAELMKNSVDLFSSIMNPVPAQSDPILEIGRTCAEGMAGLLQADSVRFVHATEDGPEDGLERIAGLKPDPDGNPRGYIVARWKNRNLYKNGSPILDAVVPFVNAALDNADLISDQAELYTQTVKQHYLYMMHADAGKRENLVRKTCCSVVAECTPYIDRLRAEIKRLSTLEKGSDGYVNALEYIGELAERLNEYNALLTQWIRIRQGAVHLTIESFNLGELMDMVARSSNNLQSKGVTLEVIPAGDCYVRADRVMTLFMLNTLVDNARKFTPKGGKVTVQAVSESDYVELSVTDTGIGMSAEDVRIITEEKVYSADSLGGAAARSGKGHGFGLMNCKGIIEKYRTTDQLFSVCRFGVDSSEGKGSRFWFRLPKGVRRAVYLLLFLIVPSVLSAQETDPEDIDFQLERAYEYADSAYNCNTRGRFRRALRFAERAINAFNQDYVSHCDAPSRLMSISDTSAPAELSWLSEEYPTDYETILWLRNEIAVSALALKDWKVYRYNDDAYLKLFKLYYGENLIEDDCRKLQRYFSNLSIALVLLSLILMILLVVWVVVLSRNILRYRSDLKQVLKIVERISAVTSKNEGGRIGTEEYLQRVAKEIFDDVNLLYEIDGMVVTLEDDSSLKKGSWWNGTVDERLEEKTVKCFGTHAIEQTVDSLCVAVPLVIHPEQGDRVIGSFGVRFSAEPDETWQMVTGMVSDYMASTLYNCIVMYESGQRNIEQIEEESERIRFEDNRLHVNNLILDNCLSTIKHETIYYPSRLQQMIADPDDVHVSDMAELAGYYRDIFGILSGYALIQAGEPIVAPQKLSVADVFERAQVFHEKNCRHAGVNMELSCHDNGLSIRADKTLVDVLIENLLVKSMQFPGCQAIELRAVQSSAFVRTELLVHGAEETQERLDSLFAPVRQNGDMSFVLCRQVIREHDEHSGHSGCRINAERYDGGVVIWFTLPMV